eukprot:10232742-Prorocentrum_lima.AAC.1
MLYPPLPDTTEVYTEGPAIAVPARRQPQHQPIDQEEREARMEFVAFLGAGIPKAVSAKMSPAAQAAQLGRKL